MYVLFKYTKVVLVLLFFCIGFFVRCANPAAPQGGPVDSLPPKIVSMLPANFTKHFNAQKIIITFDEYIQLKDVQKNTFISPELPYRPRITTKGRSVVVELKELDSATTYKIDFGSAIVDNNEGNILRGFSYVFSTGSHIDSLALSGQVIDAFKRDSLLNAVVLLFDASADSLLLDSTLLNTRPKAVARTDSMGVFLATNLKNQNYRLYAIVDKNGNMKYEKGEEMVAFLDSSYNPALMPPFKVWYNPQRRIIEATPQLLLEVFSEVPVRRQVISEIKRIKREQLNILFSARHPRIDSFSLDSIDSSAFILAPSRYGDTLTVWIDSSAVISDTLKGVIRYHSLDSIGRDTVLTRKISSYQKKQDVSRKKDEISRNPFSIQVENTSITPYDQLVFKFEYPIYPPDLSKISLSVVPPSADNTQGRAPRAGQQQEKVEEKPIPVSFDLACDSIDLLRWKLKSDWVPAGKYHLSILPRTFVNIANQANDSLSSTFEIRNPAKHGVVNATVTNVPDSSKNYILQIVEGKDSKVIRSVILTSGVNKIDYIPPREKGYRIRLIEDANKNGIWDGGDLVERLKPERAVIFRDENGVSTFGIKENWEIETPIDLSAWFK